MTKDTHWKPVELVSIGLEPAETWPERESSTATLTRILTALGTRGSFWNEDKLELAIPHVTSEIPKTSSPRSRYSQFSSERDRRIALEVSSMLPCQSPVRSMIWKPVCDRPPLL